MMKIIKSIIRANTSKILLLPIVLFLFYTNGQAAEKIYFFHNDHLGTPQEVTDIDQNIVWQVGDSPFGADAPVIELIENNIRFPGQYYDEETGLHYNWNRYYDPETGRYVTSDPIGLEGGLNTYGYVLGNPIRYIDPNGLQNLADGLINAAAVGALICLSSGCLNDAFEGLGEAIGDGIGSLMTPRPTASDVTDALNRDNDVSASVPWPPKNSGNWTAICKVVDQSPDMCTDSGKSVAFGYGVAKDRTTARKAAEKMAKDLLGSSNVHHPSCKCTSPTGKRIPNCR